MRAAATLALVASAFLIAEGILPRVALTSAPVPVVSAPPPSIGSSSHQGGTASDDRLIRIWASSLHDAGRQQGELARGRIHTWFTGKEMSGVFAFAAGAGRVAFDSFKQSNTKAFPHLVEEMRGIALGANVSLDQVWCANLMPELESLMPPSQATLTGHCSDLFTHAHASKPNASTVLHGHNEDWSQVVKPLWYFLTYVALPGADFVSCAGMAYPGTLIGYAPAFNTHGVYSTQNTLFMSSTRRDGLACTLVQKNALCGPRATSLEGYVQGLHTGGWAAGASVNVVDTVHQSMANVEAYEDGFDVVTVQGNYSHFNVFKHLASGIAVDKGDNSSAHRQARVDAQPAPASRADLRALLGDTADEAYPLYRDITLTSIVLDGAASELNVWVDTNPAHHEPAYRWDLRTFFDNASATRTTEAHSLA